jgi:hypothetical protein
MTLLKTEGIIRYNPKRVNLKKTRPADQYFLTIDFPNSIGEYYRYWIKKRYGLFINSPAYGCHVTVLDGRHTVSEDYIKHWKKYDNQVIELYYSPEIYQHWKFWCLPVISNDAIMIRRELGFLNDIPLHVTIGRML